MEEIRNENEEVVVTAVEYDEKTNTLEPSGSADRADVAREGDPHTVKIEEDELLKNDKPPVVLDKDEKPVNEEIDR